MSVVTVILRWTVVASIVLLAMALTLAHSLWTQNKRLKSEAQAHQLEIELLMAQATLTEEAYQGLLAGETQITKRYEPVKHTVHRAKSSDDAPLAPVLKRTLEEL